MKSLRCRWGNAFMLALLSAAFSVSPRTVHAKPSADIVLSVPDYAWGDIGTQFLLPVRVATLADSDLVSEFNLAVYLPVDVLNVDTVAMSGDIPLVALTSTKRDSAGTRIVNVTGRGSPIVGSGVLFYLRCTAKTVMPNAALRNTVRPVALFKILRNGVYVDVLGTGRPVPVLKNGNVLVRNPTVPIMLSTGMDSSVGMGSQLRLPVRVSAAWPWDSLSTFALSMKLPMDVLMENVTPEKGAIALSELTCRMEGDRAIISGSGSFVVGEGVLFYLRCPTKTALPDTNRRNTVRNVTILPLTGEGGEPDYLNNGRIPCATTDGQICVRNPLADPIILAVPKETAVEAGEEFLLPVSISTRFAAPDTWDAITSFNFGVKIPLEVLMVDSIAIKGPAFPMGGGGFSSTKRDSVVIVGGYWTVPLLNTGVLFYLRCRANPDAIDGSIGEVRPQRLLQNNIWLSYLNERDKPTCVAQNGVVKISNPVPVPITLSLPSITQIDAGQPALIPVSVDLLTMRDSVTNVSMNIRLPSGVVFSDVSVFPGELIPDGTEVTMTPVEGGIVVSCFSQHLIAGSGELVTMRVTAGSATPDSVSGPVTLERVTSGVGYLDYFVKLKRPVVVLNGVVLIRNLNMVPVRIAVLTDSSVDAGSPCSIQVQGGGLLSFSGTTALQFALTVPPALYQSVSVQGGLLPADAVTLADAGSGLFRVSGSVPNPVGGTGTLFTMQGLTKQDIPDSTVFTIAIERLSDGGNPLPYARKGDQTPDCAVSNGAVTVRSPVSVAHGGAAIPARSEVTAYPNPFNAVITFRVHGPLSDGPIDATIFTVLGTVVRRWSQSTPEWTWDGRDASGVSVASGVYVVVVRNGEKTWQKRVTLLR